MTSTSTRFPSRPNYQGLVGVLLIATGLLANLALVSPVFADTTSLPGSFRSVTSYKSFKPNIVSTGAATYNIPITLPPGRLTTTPDLALQYNSQNTLDGSAFGYGWGISIPFIQRMPTHGTDAMYARDDYQFSDGGEMTQVSTSTFRLRTDSGDNLVFTKTNNAWTVTDKTGTTYTYGTTSQARLDNPATSTPQIYKWMLESVQDANGNTVSYTYFKDQGQIYPNTITYSGNGTTTGLFSVNFLREATPAFVSAAPGFIITTAYRTKEIDVNVSGTWAFKYALAYTTQGSSTRSLLSSVTESAQNSGSTITLPPTTLSYSQSQQGGWTYDPTWQLPSDQLGIDRGGGCTVNGQPCEVSTTPTNNTANAGGVVVMDINGDGLPDIVEGLPHDYTSDNWCSTYPGTCPNVHYQGQ